MKRNSQTRKFYVHDFFGLHVLSSQGSASCKFIFLLTTARTRTTNAHLQNFECITDMFVCLWEFPAVLYISHIVDFSGIQVKAAII